MKPITYKYKNFKIIINNDSIKVECKLGGKTLKRIYDIDHNITSVDINEEYVHLNYGHDSQYAIKFEGDAGLVIDTFDDLGEHLETIGCHDFWDDVNFLIYKIF